MIGLDTPVLLGLLRGESGSRPLARRLETEEVCTTAINLFELEALARLDAAPGRDQRLAALDRLRRKLTVLPIDERAASAAASHASKDLGHAVSATAWAILGVLEVNGCSEWITTPSARFPKVSKSVKVSSIERHVTK